MQTAGLAWSISAIKLLKCHQIVKRTLMNFFKKNLLYFNKDL